MPGETTRVFLLTPTGRCAVASVRLEGPAAVAIAERLFQPAGSVPLSALSSDRISVGRWSLDAGAHEEVVVRRVNDRAVEIHCHGGAASVAGILASLERQGAVVERQSGGGDVLSVLARAPTERTAAILLDQLHGALDRELAEIARDPQPVEGLHRLLARSELGRHLVEPWQVVLAGLPNVGKSSLINALLGFRRAIVHAAPGTTRDVVTAATALDGWPVELSDTAGQRSSDDPIEAEGVERGRLRAEQADLVVLVLDASQPVSPEESAWRARWPKALVVFNKCDLPGQRDVEPGTLGVSAVSGDGIPLLAARIAERLVPHPPAPGDAVPITVEQVELLRALLARHCSSQA